MKEIRLDPIVSNRAIQLGGCYPGCEWPSILAVSAQRSAVVHCGPLWYAVACCGMSRRSCGCLCVIVSCDCIV